LRGAPDVEIFARAQQEGWIVVTRDLGFGNVDYPLATHAGIVVLRVPSTYTAAQKRDTLQAFIAQVEPDILQMAPAIVEPGRYRIRRPGDS
jgi:predicted nuclease of predicted toxin-antitoxin system